MYAEGNNGQIRAHVLKRNARTRGCSWKWNAFVLSTVGWLAGWLLTLALVASRQHSDTATIAAIVVFVVIGVVFVVVVVAVLSCTCVCVSVSCT